MASSSAPKLVSSRQLKRVVQMAVREAAAPGQAGSDLIRWDGKIVGRRVRDRALGERFAAKVSAAVREAGVDVTPAVASIGPDIICGFVGPTKPTIKEF